MDSLEQEWTEYGPTEREILKRFEWPALIYSFQHMTDYAIQCVDCLIGNYLE